VGRITELGAFDGNMSTTPDREQLLGLNERALDARYVIEHFLGKSREKVQREFRGHASSYAEDFAYMGPEGLRYYLPAALEYLRDEQSDGDSDFCSGLLCSLSIQAEHAKMPRDVLACMKEVADYCDSHRERFGLADHDELEDDYIATIRKTAELGAAPNGGPATPVGDSGVTEGPPSVS